MDLGFALLLTARIAEKNKRVTRLMKLGFGLFLLSCVSSSKSLSAQLSNDFPGSEWNGTRCERGTDRPESSDDGRHQKHFFRCVIMGDHRLSP